jgi:hypothetical protein
MAAGRRRFHNDELRLLVEAVKIFRKDNVALSLAEALAFKLPKEIGLQLNGHYLRGINGYT